ncbi:hypothetical protein DPMN_159038 [Dreissena polymorpha]|uniref:Uncharacterized protein n=1 Tax=Dreissena polymorpha TaxID=45954 RepID=A0A9D4EIY8_DREPO|nr:hypothetical protein DPMN_159038 [Dreissena polymorpha]
MHRKLLYTQDCLEGTANRRYRETLKLVILVTTHQSQLNLKIVYKQDFIGTANRRYRGTFKLVILVTTHQSQLHRKIVYKQDCLEGTANRRHRGTLKLVILVTTHQSQLHRKIVYKQDCLEGTVNRNYRGILKLVIPVTIHQSQLNRKIVYKKDFIEATANRRYRGTLKLVILVTTHKSQLHRNIVYKQDFLVSKQMLYGVYENVISFIEEYEARKSIGKRFPRSNIALADQSTKTLEDVESAVQAQLFVFEMHCKSCPKECREIAYKDLRTKTLVWAAVREKITWGMGKLTHLYVSSMKFLLTDQLIILYLINRADALDDSFRQDPEKNC